MVNFSSVLRVSHRHGTGKGHQNWIDSLRIYCKGGCGGNGLPNFGGIGGKGGDVIIECKTKGKQGDLISLKDVFFKTFKGDSAKQRLEGGPGSNSRKIRVLGEPGIPKILEVPPGVVVTDDTTGRILKDMNAYGEKVVVAHGGKGGGPTNDWLGSHGEKRFVRLDLKLLADVGLVGFPNAGKSTLLKAISRARPKIASYPFTTIKPNLGQLMYEDGREMTMADLPGLIEGASYNIGMGHRFLKHIERTRLMLFVIDITGFRLKPFSTYRTPFETITLLNRELELYNSDLVAKPAVCLVNKMDSEGADEKLSILLSQLKDRQSEDNLKDLPEDSRPEKLVQFEDIIPMSAKFSQKSVHTVKERLRTIIDDLDEKNFNKDEKVKELQESIRLSLGEKKT